MVYMIDRSCMTGKATIIECWFKMTDLAGRTLIILKLKMPGMTAGRHFRCIVVEMRARLVAGCASVDPSFTSCCTFVKNIAPDGRSV